jgi:pyruvate,water dikinase
MASHPAVVSREFGIPAVVGTSDATLRITTGDRVRVNGSTGQVDVLSTSAKQAAQKATEESPLHI